MIGLRPLSFGIAVVGLHRRAGFGLVVVIRAVERQIAVVHFKSQDRQRRQVEPAGALRPDIGRRVRTGPSFPARSPRL